eukprot:g18292.t1
MAANDLLDVDASGTVGKAKRNPITGEDASVEEGSDPVAGLVDNGAEESSVEEEAGHFGRPLVEEGFPSTVVNRALNRVCPISRSSALTHFLPSRNSNRVPLVLTYHPTSIHIQKIIRHHF